jgi:(1->4)-alpha-D-glucan 1-alpha-D-glucosylmutase
MDGRLKLYVIHRALECRRRRPALFADGAYVPLEARGLRGEHVVAFGRALGEDRAIAVVPRFLARLHLDGPPLGGTVWAGTWLPLPSEWAARAFRNALTGEVVVPSTRDGQPGLALDAALAVLPVALLEAVDER